MDYSFLIIPDGELGPIWHDFSGNESAMQNEAKRIAKDDGYNWKEDRIDLDGNVYDSHFYISPASIQFIKIVPKGTRI